MKGRRSLVDELIKERRIEEFRESIQDVLQLGADDAEYRRVAGKVYISLVDLWGLSRSQAASLLCVSESDYQAWLREEFDSLGSDSMEKISCLIGIYKYLGTLYSGQFERMGNWLKRENSGPLYGGYSPYDLLVGADVEVFHLVRRDTAAATV